VDFWKEDWCCREIIMQGADSVMATDREGIIRLWNPASERIFGFSSEEAIGSSLDIIIPEQFRKRHWDGFYQVMATGRSSYGAKLLAVPAMRRDGSRISIEFSITLIHDPAGNLAGIASVVRDATSRWEKEQELRQRLATLEREQSSKT